MGLFFAHFYRKIEMKNLISQMLDKKTTNVLDKHLDSLHTSLKLMEHSFRKGDRLRVSNDLRSAARMSEALTRQTLIQSMVFFLNKKSSLKGAELKEYAQDLEKVMKREYEKDVLNASLCQIQNSAESGVNYREQISEMLRELADEVESGEYPTLLQRTPTREEMEEQNKEYLASLTA